MCFWCGNSDYSDVSTDECPLAASVWPLEFNLYPMSFPFTESFVTEIADAPME
jgi:hypothetical protein